MITITSIAYMMGDGIASRYGKTAAEWVRQNAALFRAGAVARFRSLIVVRFGVLFEAVSPGDAQVGMRANCCAFNVDGGSDLVPE